MSNSMALPVPILDERELEQKEKLQKRYEKLIKQSALSKVGEVAADKVPDKVKKVVGDVKGSISERELVTQAMKYAGEGFQTLEEYSARMTVSEKIVLKRINKKLLEGEIKSLDEMCYARAYDISKIVNNYKRSHVLTATVEGAATGAFGFAGIIPNLVLSLFLYFRAVQSVAMFYGYNVKENPEELEIASSVLMSALSPQNDVSNNELTAAVGKFMVFSETTAVKDTAKKTWTDMAARGKLSLFVTQIRALANKSAQKALSNAGKKPIEQTVFKGILEQLGKKATLKNTGLAMPVVGGVVGALFDTTQMKKIINYADIFYNKRFIEEKEVRLNELICVAGDAEE